jgi:hypothetical protein
VVEPVEDTPEVPTHVSTEPVVLVPVPAEPVLGVELVAVQAVVAGVMETCGEPEAPTPTFTLNVSLFAGSVTVTAAVEGVGDAALACTPALALRPIPKADRV